MIRDICEIQRFFPEAVTVSLAIALFYFFLKFLGRFLFRYMKIKLSLNKLDGLCWNKMTFIFNWLSLQIN